MYIVVRLYSDGGPAFEERARRTRDGLVPLLREHEGFRAYCAFRCDHGFAVSIVVFESSQAAVAVHERIRRWAISNLGDLTTGSPELLSGEVLYEELAPEKQAGCSPYILIAEYDAAPEALVPLAPHEREHLLRMLRPQTGPGGLYLFETEADPRRLVGVVVLDERDGRAVALQYVREAVRLQFKEASLNPRRLMAGRALVAESTLS